MFGKKNNDEITYTDALKKELAATGKIMVIGLMISFACNKIYKWGHQSQRTEDLATINAGKICDNGDTFDTELYSEDWKI